MRTTPPGKQILERARRGDERAFAVVVHTYGGLVMNIAWRMVRDRQEAEDLSQEVFVHLYRVFDRYEPDRPFEPWFRRVVRNKLLNLIAGKNRKLQKATRSLELARGEAGDLLPDPGAEEGGATASQSERARILRRATLKLRPSHRLILALRYFEGKSYGELARELGIPLGTVKNRLFRAREELAGLVTELT